MQDGKDPGHLRSPIWLILQPSSFRLQLRRAFAARDDAFGAAPSTASRAPSGVQSTIFIDFRYEKATESLLESASNPDVAIPQAQSAMHNPCGLSKIVSAKSITEDN
jgi:hypothetical protein